MGLIYPTSGHASIFGHPIGHAAAKAKLGFLPESPYFYDYLTAEELLTYIGGLYGLRIGRFFAGESMFSHQRDASKVALVALVELMRSSGMALLDVQWLTPHLASLGVPLRLHVKTAKSLEASLQNLEAMTAKIRNGEGSLGKLMTDDAFAKSLSDTTANLSAITGKLNRGEGTAGKLMTDPALFDLYDRQRRTVAQEFLQRQTIENKKNIEMKSEAARRAKLYGDAALSWEGWRAQWKGQGLDFDYFLGRDFSKLPANSFVIRKADFDDASKKDIEAIVAQSQKRSAVYDVITNPVNVTVEVV